MAKGILKKCKSCGSNLAFDPSSGDLKCNMCGTLYPFESKSSFNRRVVDLSTLTASNKLSGENVNIPKCKCCGASFGGKILSITSKCEYCGATMVPEDFASAPDGCVPYAFGEDEALKKFEEELKSKFFIPKALKKGVVPSSIESIYIPAFSFSSNVKGVYDGRLYERETDRDGNSSKRKFNVSGTEYADYDDIMVECSEHITQSDLRSIEPFDMDKAKAFMPEFVCGYSVEYYNRTVEDSAKIARETMRERLKNQALKRYHYDGIDYFNMSYTYDDSKYAYMLLPTYKIKFTFKGKEYAPLLNGQTGKLGGKLPSTKLKTVLITLGLLAVIGGIVYLVASGTLNGIIEKYFKIG